MPPKFVQVNSTTINLERVTFVQRFDDVYDNGTGPVIQIFFGQETEAVYNSVELRGLDATAFLDYIESTTEVLVPYQPK